MIEKTLVLIKWDAIEKDAELEIIMRYQELGLKIVGFKVLCPMSREIAAELYKEHEGQYFYERLMDFMTQKVTIALIVEGENAIALVREANGATDPTKAAIGTIRQMYGTGGPANAVHASDSKKSSAREIPIIFS